MIPCLIEGIKTGNYAQLKETTQGWNENPMWFHSSLARPGKVHQPTSRRPGRQWSALSSRAPLLSKKKKKKSFRSSVRDLRALYPHFYIWLRVFNNQEVVMNARRDRETRGRPNMPIRTSAQACLMPPLSGLHLSWQQLGHWKWDCHSFPLTGSSSHLQSLSPSCSR